MLHFQIDPHSGIPVYRQLMDQIKYYAASGALQPGNQLPSIRELAKALSVNPTTIVKAYSELEHEGVIVSKHGKGMFVTGQANDMTDTAIHDVLHRLARQLAVEAAQMGATREQVKTIVEEEINQVLK